LIRLFLDANVLFTAAHNPDGKAAFIISLGDRGAWTLHTSSLAVEESRRNLRVKYPSTEKNLTELLSHVTVVSEAAGAFPCPKGLDVKDHPIFQAAYACRATHLITGDLAHFGSRMEKPHKTFGIVIITAARFLDSL
jgi:predicted nucleic acid-binding protein